MRLKLSIGGLVIASIPLNEKEAGNPEYIRSQCCQLTEVCTEIIALQPDAPVYFIEVASRMNRKAKKGRRGIV